MKKNLLILAVIAIVLSFNKVKAQTVNYGLKAGLNVSSFQGQNDGISRSSLLGYHVGLVAENRLNRYFAIQPEFLFTHVGGEEHYMDGNQGRYYLDYISIPVMAKFYVADQLSLDFGPQLGILIKDTAKYIDDYYDYDAGANTLDFGFNIGLSLHFDRYWFAQARYSIGVTPVLENPDVQNGVFQLSIGHRF